MLTFSAKIRKETGRKTKALRRKGIVPAVLYGSKIKENLLLELDSKTFEKTYKEAGESSLLSLDIAGKKFLVLINEVKKNSLTGEIIHVDFFQPKLEKEVEVAVPIIFEGIAPAVKDFGGTLVKSISEIEVKALPQKLPHEIKVDISVLKTFEDAILVKDLIISKEVKILKEPDETVVFVAEPEKVEEELEKPVEEKVEEVEKVEQKEKKEETEVKEE